MIYGTFFSLCVYMRVCVCCVYVCVCVCVCVHARMHLCVFVCFISNVYVEKESIIMRG